MNDSANMPRTARDALIIEMLGDLGRLHDSVNELKNTLPAQTQSAVSAIAGQTEKSLDRLTQLIGYIAKITDSFKSQFDQYVNLETRMLKAAISQVGEEERVKIAADLAKRVEEIEIATAEAHKTLSREASDRLQQIVDKSINQIRDRLDRELVRPVKAAAASLHRNVLYTVFACLIAGAIGGGASTWLSASLNSNTNELRGLGQAVQAAWPSLDEHAKGAILEQLKKRSGK